MTRFASLPPVEIERRELPLVAHVVIAVGQRGVCANHALEQLGPGRETKCLWRGRRQRELTRFARNNQRVAGDQQRAGAEPVDVPHYLARRQFYTAQRLAEFL